MFRFFKKKICEKREACEEKRARLTAKEVTVGDKSCIFDFSLPKPEKIIYFFYHSGDSSDDDEDNTLYVPHGQRRALPATPEPPTPQRPRAWGPEPDRIKRFSTDEDKEGWLWVRR